MIEYKNLLGRQYETGVSDCWSIAIDYYWQNHGLRLTNYARPSDLPELGWSLYLKYLETEGFEMLDIPVRLLKPSDLILMTLRSNLPHHAAVYVGEGKIIQHLPGRLSSAVFYDGTWRSATTNLYRHKLVKDTQTIPEMTLEEARKNVLGY